MEMNDKEITKLVSECAEESNVVLDDVDIEADIIEPCIQKILQTHFIVPKEKSAMWWKRMATACLNRHPLSYRDIKMVFGDLFGTGIFK